jgi:L-ascorbate metabolism protein UlaG (beta-lactamase superfamily)
LKDRLVYLRDDLKIEPIVAGWHAWVPLISPATAAMSIALRYLRIAESYVNAPELHAAAAKDPASAGGPFIDLGGKRVEEIRQWAEWTRSELSEFLHFAEAVKELDSLLTHEAKGMRLEPLYDRIPGPLRGFVELVYDRYHHPSFRIFERLLYQSPLYRPSLQSVSLSPVTSDDRPFTLGTPRLPGDPGLLLRLPFSSSELDEVYRLKTTAQPRARVMDLLEPFLTEKEPPRPRPRYTGEKLRVSFFGQATILAETRGMAILVDPVISYPYAGQSPRLTYRDLPEFIDYVLLTHGHQDHAHLETLLHLKHRIGTLVVPRNQSGALQDPSLKLVFEQLGFNSVREIEPFESLPLPEGSLTGVPFFGEHGDLDIQAKTGFVLHLAGQTILCAADSTNLAPETYRRVKRLHGRIDLLLVSVMCESAPLSWIYRPMIAGPLGRDMDQSRGLVGCNSAQALSIVEELDAREVLVYALGNEPWISYLSGTSYTDSSPPIAEADRLVEACVKRGLRARRLYGSDTFFLEPLARG